MGIADKFKNLFDIATGNKLLDNATDWYFDDKQAPVREIADPIIDSTKYGGLVKDLLLAKRDLRNGKFPNIDKWIKQPPFSQSVIDKAEHNNPNGVF